MAYRGTVCEASGECKDNTDNENGSEAAVTFCFILCVVRWKTCDCEFANHMLAL